MKVYSWFRYIDGPKNDPLSYNVKRSGTPSCPGDNVLCAIYAEVQFIDFKPRPVITEDLYKRILLAEATHRESDEILLEA